jgi:hypothetical protein
MKTLAVISSCVCFMFFALPQVANAAYNIDAQKDSTKNWNSKQDKNWDQKQDKNYLLDSEKSSQDPHNMIYVITGPSGNLDGDLLTINSVPQVFYFTKDSKKQAGQLSAEEFINKWKTAADAQGSKATLVINSDQGPQQTIVMLSDPKVVNGNITYKAEIIEGDAPGSFADSSLFIYGISCPTCQ